jgi:hypothetical protein
VTEINHKTRTKIITYPNGTKKQCFLDDNTVIYEDAIGNVMQVNPDGSKQTTAKDGTQYDVLTDGTIIIEKNGEMIQKDADGSIVKGDGTVIEANDVHINLTILFEQALESTSEEKFIPVKKEKAPINEEKEKNVDESVSPSIVRHGKKITSEDFIIGLVRIHPSSSTFSTNRNGLKKITVGTLMKVLEKQNIEKKAKTRNLCNREKK